jgi:putative SOS response-associated peptidase YedK
MELKERFDATADFDYEPRYNIAPRQDLATIRNTDVDTITQQNWELLALWADNPDDGPRPINARAETLTEKRMFKESLEERRCLVLSNGFYE